ncbi:MAG: hypothetical protein FWF78_06290 [Defluviitaleaceae bacterium]|nr:hypothetical protein [Defluviitaleaceae bacterium]
MQSSMPLIKKKQENKNHKMIRCRRCGNMFEVEGLVGPICDSCRLEREEQFQIVRIFVREHPGISALEVHQCTEIPMEAILKYINAGLLEVVNIANADGEVSERVGFMLKKAEAKKVQLDMKKTGTSAPPVPSMDNLKTNEPKEKFTWHGDGGK